MRGAPSRKSLQGDPSENESDYMRRVLLFSLLGCGLFIASSALAREVNSKEDLERLRGFQDQISKEDQLERERLSDVDQVKRAAAAVEKQRHDALSEYRVEKAKQKARLDESSPEYKEDLKAKTSSLDQHDKERREYIKVRDASRREQHATVTLTEEHELGIDQDPPRVEWKKRGFFAKAGSGKGMGGSHSGDSGGSRTPEPSAPMTPPPPPPDFYESEPPPPPPPPPPMFDPGIPQGGFDELMPPPVFDDPEF